MRKISYGDYGEVLVKKGRYGNGNLALVLIEENSASPIAKITVNTDEVLEEGLAYVKNYSENEGMLEAVLKTELAIEVLGVKQMNWVTVPLVRFDMSGIDEL